MRKTSRLLCVFLCITLLFLSVFAPNSYAYSPQMRVVTSGGGSSVNMRVAPDQSSASVCSVPSGSIVIVNSVVSGTEAISGSGTDWCYVTYNGAYTGYIYGKYLADIKQYFNPDFETNLLNFPESYREPLRAIHYQYPNWQFVAEYVDMSLDTAINYEYSQSNVTQTKKWVDMKINGDPAWIDSRVNMNDSSHIKESHWTFASRNAIAYFMDPRNALTVANTVYYYPNIFQFLQHTYDPSAQTVEGLRLVVAGTFLANGYGGDPDAYINDIMRAAAESDVSPYVIAAIIKVEQGKGTSDLISGTYPGYEGYYNFFNWKATGANLIVNGLTRAISEGWSSRNASIVGGSKLYRKYYVDRSQDTYYYKDFNVWGSGSHQYATSLYDQASKGISLKSACISNPYAALTFRIPVYADMPPTAYAVPTGAVYDPAQPVQARRKGDYDGDGQITVKELATIRMYLLGVKGLSVEEKSYVDVSGDKDVTVKDLALVRMYLLGLISL